MKITAYMVASDHTEEGLRKEVKELIANGWQPFGSIAATPETANLQAWLYQPMVKYE